MTRNLPKEERFEEIINAAVAEFVEKGYENASMDSIAKRAGVSKGGLYHHFKSKEEIMIFANNVFIKPIEQMMEKAIKGESPTEGLRTYIFKYVDFWSKHPKQVAFVFLSMIKAIGNKEMWISYEGYILALVDFFESIINKGIAKKEFKKCETKEIAVALAASLDGLISYVIMSKKITAKVVSSSIFNSIVKPILK
jgi:AcrR family transcriptional regulator